MELKPLNTLALNCAATHYIEVDTCAALSHALRFFSTEKVTPIVLGDGSNIVLRSSNVAGCLKVSSRGVKLLSESAGNVILEVAAGENWNNLVDSCLAAGYHGLENLALIPGTVGAAPVQNIGAYGVELSEFVDQIKFRNLHSGERETFNAADCEFAYRESIFKNRLRDATVIEAVRLRLSKKPIINCRYEALAKATAHIDTPTPKDIRDAVVKMRRSKLPDPQRIANAGSFFKNPVVDVELVDSLLTEYKEMVNYPTSDPLKRKLAAAWLIEQCGWKGRFEGQFGMHEHQALVLVNKGGSSGKMLLEFADGVRNSVFEKFSIWLDIEPRIY